jgi:GWxTD domain-containing protein
MKLFVHKLAVVIILFSVPFISVAEKLKVNFNYLLFSIPDEFSYVELQFFFHGNGLTYQLTEKGTYQAFIVVNISFIKDDTVIKRNYIFSSDEYQDTVSKPDNVYNVVRIPLPSGICQMKITTFDKNALKPDTLFFKDKLEVDNSRNNVRFSDIMPIGFFAQATKKDNFTKHGIDYIPYFSNFYPENIKLLTFMAEIYNTDNIIKNTDFVIHSYISQQNKNKPISSQYEKWEAAKKTDMHVLFQSFNIDSLPSGNYELKIEIRDRKDTLHTYTSYFFQRSNPLIQNNIARTDSLPYDTLKLYLEYIRIIATPEEQLFIDNISPKKYREIEDFFTAFWIKRDKEKPHEAWYKYYNQVMRTNYNYSTLKQKGFRTDRGYYYLKYGPPSDIEYHHSSVNGPPYEIWTYNTMFDGQINVYFVFYNADLVTNDFKLLHSTARGLFKNDRWREILHISDDEFREISNPGMEKLNINSKKKDELYINE